jgi:hypothetical protein
MREGTLPYFACSACFCSSFNLRPDTLNVLSANITDVSIAVINLMPCKVFFSCVINIIHRRDIIVFE